MKTSSISYCINKYLLDLINHMERENSDAPLLDMASELKFSPLFKILNEKLFVIALENGVIINSFFGIKNIPRDESLRLYPDFLQYKITQTVLDDSQEEVFDDIILFKGTLIKVLEKMKLEKTKNEYIKQLVIEDPEIDEKKYYTKKEIERFSRDDFEVILKEELKKKFKDKPVIIRFS
jgi:hypothetical protein